MLIGYAQVSTAEQTLALQTDALTAVGCEKLFTDVAGGARTERPGLDQAIEFCRTSMLDRYLENCSSRGIGCASPARPEGLVWSAA
jgi:DNA invertase Pin-like site-specific DNA recombinase